MTFFDGYRATLDLVPAALGVLLAVAFVITQACLLYVIARTAITTISRWIATCWTWKSKGAPRPSGDQGARSK